LTFSIRRTFSEQIFLNEDNESLQKGISWKKLNIIFRPWNSVEDNIWTLETKLYTQSIEIGKSSRWEESRTRPAKSNFLTDRRNQFELIFVRKVLHEISCQSRNSCRIFLAIKSR
jgi:hypothetical protein